MLKLGSVYAKYTIMMAIDHSYFHFAVPVESFPPLADDLYRFIVDMERIMSRMGDFPQTWIGQLRKFADALFSLLVLGPHSVRDPVQFAWNSTRHFGIKQMFKPSDILESHLHRITIGSRAVMEQRCFSIQLPREFMKDFATDMDEFFRHGDDPDYDRHLRETCNVEWIQADKVLPFLYWFRTTFLEQEKVQWSAMEVWARPPLGLEMIAKGVRDDERRVAESKA